MADPNDKAGLSVLERQLSTSEYLDLRAQVSNIPSDDELIWTCVWSPSFSTLSICFGVVDGTIDFGSAPKFGVITVVIVVHPHEYKLSCATNVVLGFLSCQEFTYNFFMGQRKQHKGITAWIYWTRAS